MQRFRFKGVKVSQSHRQVERLSELANILITIEIGTTISVYIWRSLRKNGDTIKSSVFLFLKKNKNTGINICKIDFIFHTQF